MRSCRLWRFTGAALLAAVSLLAIVALFIRHSSQSRTSGQPPGVALPSEEAQPARTSRELQDALATIRRFAERYEPISTPDAVIPGPPVLGEEMTQAVRALAAVGAKEDEPYVTLILLRLYRFQQEHFHQSYEMRDFRHPENSESEIVTEFCRLAPICDKHLELLMPDVAWEWATAHPSLLDYPPIRQELDRMARPRVYAKEKP